MHCARRVDELFVVDAFTDHTFGGNQAGVAPMSGPGDAALMQKIAAEMKYSETAFLWPEGDAWGLRWFTPAKEVPLCGHATLASAHILWETKRLPAGKPALFDTLSGRLTCTQTPQGIQMDFPADPATPEKAPAGLFEALGARGPAHHAPRYSNLLIELPDERAVRAVTPDFGALRKVSDSLAYIVAAPASTKGFDVVCRYFAPAWGIDEDPATGSIQCTIGPHFSRSLGKNPVRVLQASQRGAQMIVETSGQRVKVTGNAVTVVAGRLKVRSA